MNGLVTPTRIIVASLVIVAGLFAVGWATRLDPGEKPIIAIVGGGFIFNYRVADNFYGFTAVVQRPLESGSIIEASFEDPAGGPPIVVRQRVSPISNNYAMRTPPLRGIEAQRPYTVAVRVLDREESRELYAAERTYRSDIGDENMPKAPLTVGPGYDKNPQAGG